MNGFCPAGNLVLNAACPTGSFTPTYSYDIENRLTSFGVSSYVYDGDGNRVKKCTNAGCTTGTLYWRGTSSDPITEMGVTGSVAEEYVFFDGRRVARRDSAGPAFHYYFSDHLGSTDLITDLRAQRFRKNRTTTHTAAKSLSPIAIRTTTSSPAKNETLRAG